LSRFVGRERAMATLQALLAQAEDGRGQVVGLVGEPGIGKSRLMSEFRRRLARRRLTYLSGRCLSYGSGTPYLSVLDILRHNCGITDADRPETIQAKVHLSPQAIKARTFATLTQMYMNRARRRSLVLEIEDLPWIDPTSEEYLASLVKQLAGVPILLLTTYQPGYPDQALTCSEEALALARNLSHPFSSGLALDYAAMLHQFRREPGAVRDLAEAAVTLCAEQEFAYYLAWGKIMRGWAVAELGDRETGVADMRQGLAALRATGAGLRQPYYLGLLAEAWRKTDRAEEGLTLLAEALKVMDNTGEHWWEAELHGLKGELLWRQALGDISRSPLHREDETCYRRALGIARRQQAKCLVLRAAISLCRL
jgi:tetratricopeptide (TPR) repeat protein